MKLIITLLFLGIIAKAQPLGEGWHNVAPERISLDEKLASFSSQAKLQETSSQQAAEVATNSISANLANPDFAELEELAKGLKYDPLLIFEHVVNHYEIKFYDGIVKGALQTFYDRAGNDWDLCLLCAKLLEISQMQNADISDVRIAYGYVVMSNEELASWVGCVNNRAIISGYLADSRIAFNDSNAAQYTVERTWLKVTYRGTVHFLDVGHKPHTKRAGIDIKTAMNLDGAVFYQQAGGVTGVDWVSGMNQTSIKNYLNARCGDLKSYLKNQHENDGMLEVLGGKKIIAYRYQSLPVGLNFYHQEVASYSLRDLPASEFSQIQFQHRAINVTYPLHEIAGRKIALVYADGSGASAMAEEAAAMIAEETPATGLLIPPSHTPEIQNGGTLAIEPEDNLSERIEVQAEAVAAANQLVEFGARLQGSADVLNGFVYSNPSLGNWIRLESRMISGGNAFRPEHAAAKRIEYGQSIQLAAYLNNSTLARGNYTGQIEYKLHWANLSAPFQIILHDLSGRVSERASLTYSEGYASAQIGQIKDFTVSFKNTGTQPLSISSIALSGTGASQFAFVNGNGAGSLAAGATRVITLRYTADAQATHKAAVNVTLAYDGISGYSLPISVEGTGFYLPRAQLYIDDVLVAEEPVGTLGESVEDFIWSIDHNGSNRDQTATYTVKRGATYAVCSDFGHSKQGQRLKSAQRKLNRSRAANPDTSQAVMTDTLQLMGQTWMQQTAQGNQILEALTKSELYTQHRFGLVAQEEGYSIDVKHEVGGTKQLSNDSVNHNDTFIARTYFDSALEHGVLEQLQVNRPATSTVKVFRLANEQNGRIYRMDASNVAALTSGILDNYPQTVIDQMKTVVNQENGKVTLPENGNLSLYDWAGYGYAQLSYFGSGAIKKVAMSIKGNYGTLNGGYGAYLGNIDSSSVSANYFADLLDAGEVYRPLSNEPVDLSTGAYYFDHTDLELGQGEPRGIRFSRTYNSLNADHDNGLGFGWDHNWNSYLTEYSEADHGLAMRRAADAIPQLVAAQALLEMEKQTDSAKTDVLKSLIADWATDALNDQAIAVHIYGKVLVFTKLPDGSFVSPPGITEELVKVTNGYELRGRFGIVQSFQLVGNTYRLRTWKNADQQTLTVSYSGDKPSLVTDAYGRTMTLNYTNGRISSVVDSTGRRIEYGYSAAGDLTSFTDADRFTSRFGYDAKHQITELYDASNRLITRNIYNDFGRVTRQMSEGSKEWNFYYSDFMMIEQDPTKAEKIYQYDALKQLEYFADAEGNRTQSQFNGHRKVISSRDPIGKYTYTDFDQHQNPIRQTEYLYGFIPLTTEFTYLPNHLLETMTDPKGNVGKHWYDAEFHRTKTTNPLLEEVSWTYTANGEVLSEKTIGQNHTEFTTTFGYDAYGNQNLSTYPDGTTQSAVFNARGHVTSQRDRRGFMTSYTPDQRGNVTNTSYPLAGMTSSAAYDYRSDLLSATNPRGFVTKHTYSPMFQKTSTTLAFGAMGGDFTTSFGYDTRDFATTVSSPMGFTTTSLLDDAGRAVGSVNPLGNRHTWVLDENGNVTESTNPLLQTSTTLFDTLNRPISQTQPFAVEEVVERYYDFNGNLTQLRNGKEEEFEMSYDALNRLTSLSTPEGRISRRSYTKRGQVESSVEPSGEVTSFAYDALNRLATQVDGVGTVTLNHLDGVGDSTSSVSEAVSGNPGTVAAGTHTTTRVHDALERVTSFTDMLGSSIGYEYDFNGNVTRITYPSQGDGVTRAVNYQYSSRDLLETVTDWQGRVTRYTYDRDGRLTLVTNANGSLSAMKYDAASRLLEQKDTGRDGFLIALQRMEFDAADKITSRFVVPQRQNSTALLRTADFQATYDRDNRMTSFKGMSLASDADGNLLNAPAALLGETTRNVALSYDARNRLKSADGLSYRYDFEGHRNQVIGAEVTTWVNDPISSSLSRPLSKTVNGQTTYYIWGNGLVYQINPNGTTSTYHFDQVGSTVAISADDGISVTDRFEYSPYGLRTHREGTSDIVFQYNGKFGVQTDANGLLYMRARYYHPVLRRFLNQDPIGFEGGMNWYAYAGGNPVTKNDPRGLATVGVGLQAGGGAMLGITVSAGVYVGKSGWNPFTGWSSGLLFSGGGGIAAGAGGSAAVFLQATNAPNVNNLKGPGFEIGISAGEVFPIVGVDYVGGLGNKDGSNFPVNTTTFNGFSVSAGVGGGTPIEAHANVTGTAGFTTDPWPSTPTTSTEITSYNPYKPTIGPQLNSYGGQKNKQK